MQTVVVIYSLSGYKASMKRIILLLSLSLYVGKASADIPQVVSYQGVLADSSGNLLPDGDYSLTFKLFRDSAGGTALWSEFKELYSRNGIVLTMLGDTEPFTHDMFSDELWLEISVNGAALPARLRMAACWYAMRAKVSDSSLVAAAAHESNLADTALLSNVADSASVSAQSDRSDSSRVSEKVFSRGVGVESDTIITSSIQANGDKMYVGFPTGRGLIMDQNGNMSLDTSIISGRTLQVNGKLGASEYIFNSGGKILCSERVTFGPDGDSAYIDLKQYGHMDGLLFVPLGGNQTGGIFAIYNSLGNSAYDNLTSLSDGSWTCGNVSNPQTGGYRLWLDKTNDRLYFLGTPFYTRTARFYFFQR